MHVRYVLALIFIRIEEYVQREYGTYRGNELSPGGQRRPPRKCSSIITPIQVDGAHILVHILRVMTSDSARNLHVPYICSGTYSSYFGKPERYAVERCVRNCLALVHRH